MSNDMILFLKYNNMSVKTINYYLKQNYDTAKMNRNFVYNDLKRFLQVQ